MQLSVRVSKLSLSLPDGYRQVLRRVYAMVTFPINPTTSLESACKLCNK